MSESVDILIKAEDMATPVIDNAAKAVDGLDTNIKKIKESGQQAKKSTDFFKVIANSLGGTQIGSYVGQIGEAAEKTSQFAEVQKLGGAGALAFKAGLVGLVGTIAFGVGNTIGNAIFQTERWKKSMADSTEEAKKLQSALASLQEQRFSEGKSDIELIRDPEAKQKAYEELFAATNRELSGVEKRITAAKEKVEAYNASWTPSWIQGNNDAMELRLKTEKETHAALMKQREAVNAVNLERAEANRELQKQNALQDKSNDYLKGLRDELELLRATKEEQAGILAIRNAIGVEAQAEAKRLLLEKEAIATAAEAAKEKKAADDKLKADQDAILQGSANYVKSLREQLDIMKATDEQRAGVMAAQKAVGGDVATATGLLKDMELIQKDAEDKKRIADQKKKDDDDAKQRAEKARDLKESELQKLEQERILLTQGAEAAKAFALEKQGLSKADAASIAKQEAELERMKKKQEMLNKPAEKPEFEEIKGAGPIVASESRLLKRGASDDPTVMVAKNTNKMIEQNEALREEIRLMTQELAEIKENSKMEMEAVA